jgi:acetate kinase
VATKSQEAAYISHHWNGQSARQEMPMPDHRSAAQAVLEHLQQKGIPTPLIGHRFVHGGAEFKRATLIDGESLPRLQATRHLAPIHNPNSLSVIDLCLEMCPDARQYAVFDTAFHAAMPESSYRYALPCELSDRLGLRKYGFHGLSYQYCCLQTSHYLKAPVEDLKIVACHLGTGGSSVAAIQGGRSLDTSMGYSPLPGLMMSTRSGDIDPAIVLELLDEHGCTTQQVNRLLNKDSGLSGVSGFSSDLMELVEAAQRGHPRATLAVDMYIQRLKHYVGAYLALLNGADALVFTDDIGVRGWTIRDAVCTGLSFCGVKLDQTANRFAPSDALSVVSAQGSSITVLTIPTDEEWVIAREGMKL